MDLNQHNYSLHYIGYVFYILPNAIVYVGSRHVHYKCLSLNTVIIFH